MAEREGGGAGWNRKREPSELREHFYAFADGSCITRTALLFSRGWSLALFISRNAHQAALPTPEPLRFD